MTTNNSTVKVPAVTKENEREYLKRKLDEATVAMINHSSEETIAAFLAANKRYFEVESLYASAWRILTEQTRRAIGSVLGINSF